MHEVKRLLVATDFSEGAEGAYRQGLFWARRFAAAELHVLHVVTAPERMPKAIDVLVSQYKEEAFRDLESRAASRLEALLESRPPEALRIKTAVRRGQAAGPAVLAYAQDYDADLIVVGAHGHRGVRRLVSGRTSAEIARHAERPVLIARHCEHALPAEGGGRILAPVDFSEHSRRAAAAARVLAAACEATLYQAHVLERPLSMPRYGGAGVGSPGAEVVRPGGERSAGALRDRAREKLQQVYDAADGPEVPTESVVLDGHASSALTKFAEEKDIGLIVMGSHGRTGLKRLLLGSVTERVMRRAPCPLLVIKTFGRRFLSEPEPNT